MNNIIQLNLQSLKSQFSELKILLNEFNPICVCLQETMCGNRKVFPPSGYDILTSATTRDGHERGTAILVRSGIFYEPFHIDST